MPDATRATCPVRRRWFHQLSAQYQARSLDWPTTHARTWLLASMESGPGGADVRQIHQALGAHAIGEWRKNSAPRHRLAVSNHRNEATNLDHIRDTRPVRNRLFRTGSRRPAQKARWADCSGRLDRRSANFNRCRCRNQPARSAGSVEPAPGLDPNLLWLRTRRTRIDGAARIDTTGPIK